jgi:hypothetical protein
MSEQAHVSAFLWSGVRAYVKLVRCWASTSRSRQYLV